MSNFIKLDGYGYNGWLNADHITLIERHEDRMYPYHMSAVYLNSGCPWMNHDKVLYLTLTPEELLEKILESENR